MVRLVFIPSYGTNASLYDNLMEEMNIPHECIFTDWIPIRNAINLQEYAQSYIEEYNIQAQDILIGVSLGGVLAIEINKILHVQKIISISSIKSKEEKPLIFRFLQSTKAYKLAIPQLMKFGLDILLPFYGRNAGSYLWFRRVFKASDNQFLQWSLAEIVTWQNEEVPDNIIHIHGTSDPLFPINNCSKIDHQIKNGTHAMIRFKAKEIAEILKSEIN